MFNPFLTHHPRIPPTAMATPADHLATGLEPEAELIVIMIAVSVQRKMCLLQLMYHHLKLRRIRGILLPVGHFECLLQEWHGWCGRDICRQASAECNLAERKVKVFLTWPYCYLQTKKFLHIYGGIQQR